MKKASTLLLFVFVITQLQAQLRLDTLGWIAPLDIPIFLSGNFAELRSGHFHSGIDMKTQGKEGFPVHAVQNGYVSRIKVSSGGYGNAIYITHPDGYTSVYGHLKEYNIQIEKYVRNIQYKKKSFEVDIFPECNELPVKQGDIIGLSGDTGRSGGPHLHFEIRDSRNSHPLNGLFLGYDIKDNIPPKMEYLYVYPQDISSNVNKKNYKHYYGLKKINGKYIISRNDTINVHGNIGFGLKVNDYLNGSSNRCGVYELKAYIDGKLFFHDKFDGFSFGETRYINSLMDYQESVTKRRRLHKLWVEPNNKLSVYVDVLNRGIINFENDNKIHKIKIVAEDAYLNKSELIFYTKYSSYTPKQKTIVQNQFTIPWEKSFSLDTLGMSLNFSSKTFYDTLFMKFSADSQIHKGFYAGIYNIHNNTVPAHKYFQISIRHIPVPDSLNNKLLLAYKYKNKYVSAGGIEKNGVVTGMVRSLGTYSVMIDTIAPVITPIGAIATSSDISNAREIKFIIKDNFSGISKYNGYINGHWVLFAYDAKNNLLTYRFDEYMPEQGTANVKLVVTDNCGNTSVYTKSFEVYANRDNDIGQ